jgi:2-deoxy-D-gluconate 3-dehydrogenase
VFDAAEEMGAVPLQADLTEREQALTMVARAVEALGGLDVLVNNAGTIGRFPAKEYPLDVWDDVLTLNLDAVWILAQAAGRTMLAQGGGKIINIASLLSFFGGITVPSYAASKGGVAQLTKALSNEWAGYGVNVNAIAPGYMDTALCEDLVGNPDREPLILSRIPAGRWGVPSDLKGTVIFLASSASDYVHGAILPVDGGYLGR